MDRSSKQKINKETQILNDTLDILLISSGHSIQMQKNTPSSQVHVEHYPGIDHILGHKSNLSKFKKIEIISSIFSDHNAMRLDISYKEKNCKKHKHMEIKQHVSK